MEFIGNRLLPNVHRDICSRSHIFTEIKNILVQKLRNLTPFTILFGGEAVAAPSPGKCCTAPTLQECLRQLGTLSADSPRRHPSDTLFRLTRSVADVFERLKRSEHCKGCGAAYASLTEIKQVVEHAVAVLSLVAVQVKGNPSDVILNWGASAITVLLATITRLRRLIMDMPLLYHLQEDDDSVWAHDGNLARFDRSAGDFEIRGMALTDLIFESLFMETNKRNLISQEDWDKIWFYEYTHKIDLEDAKREVYERILIGIACSFEEFPLHDELGPSSREI